MTAADVLREAKRLGVHLTPEGDRIRVRGPKGVASALSPKVAEHRAELLFALREAIVAEARGTIAPLAAQTLLREGRWPASASPCFFFIGPAGGAKCVRCSGPWLEHFPPNGAA